MGVQSGLAGEGMRVCKFRDEPNNGRSKKRSRRKLRLQPLVQTLYDTCKIVFAAGGTGLVPSSEGVRLLASVMDSLKAEDVGLTPQMPYFQAMKSKGAPKITYLHLYECDKFSMGIFCLPPSAVIPLHNHPGMTVFSKLLFGTIHIKSYDWEVDNPLYSASKSETSQNQGEVFRLAKLHANAEFSAPCNTSVLYPAAGGNMHCFTAIAACAILDVLGPPYSGPDGRHCTYYLEHPVDSFSADGVKVPEGEKDRYAWLKERENPDDLVVEGALYRGPTIVET